MKFGTRLTLVSALFVSMFGVLGVRLWFVQVAEGAQSAVIAEEQTWVTINSQAPRGDIFDRSGNLLVTSRFVPQVVVDRRFVDPEARADLIQRLSGLLAIPASDLEKLYEDAGVNGRFPVTTVSAETAYRIQEQLSDLPGVGIEKIPERVYLVGPTMAHAIGHLGLPDQTDLDSRTDLDPNLRIGKLGVERVYDEYLQGDPGSRQLRLNRNSEVVEERPPVAPTPGDALYLTLDLRLQEIAEQALESGVLLSNQVKQIDRADGEEVYNDTQRAAVVVLDIKTGAVLALASFPDFDPSLFVEGVDPETFLALNDAQAFNNLAVAGLYPPASTFKAITYVAALEENLPLAEENLDPRSGLIHCNSTLRLQGPDEGDPFVFHDWYRGDKGFLDVHEAFEQSCNIYFWSVALGTWREFKNTDQESIIQDWARQLGFGEQSGIDLTGEATGIVPDRALFEEWKQFQVENPEAPARLASERLTFPDGPFLGGDLMNVAIGQGALAATPLQVAMSYAAIANGGTVYRPHVVGRIVGRSGETIFQAQPTVIRQVDISPGTVQSFLGDMNRVVTRGTASVAFDKFGDSLDQVGGKTGTGQTLINKDNHAWFVGLGPIDDPRWVVAVVIDEGGSGGRVAAPVARHIMQYLMGESPTPIVEGEEAD
ncbi:MAG: penicillin-binding transpeptidase domain-containing protein [Acidimicrobiia bacterium]